MGLMARHHTSISNDTPTELHGETKCTMECCPFYNSKTHPLLSIKVRGFGVKGTDTGRENHQKFSAFIISPPQHYTITNCFLRYERGYCTQGFKPYIFPHLYLAHTHTHTTSTRDALNCSARAVMCHK